MLFRGKNLSDLNEQDLLGLVKDQVQERDTIEYKRDMYGNSDDDKREMLKDIASLANHHGGVILIGISEDEEGIPTNVVGIEAGNHVERITSSCLDNIDKRIVGLEIKDISLNNGKVVVVISIPESINAPHMVTYRGLNQFWKRPGRQKDKMTIDEVGAAFDKRLSNLNRLDRFLFTRKAQILENIGNQTQMVISAFPAFLRDEVVLDVNDDKLKQMILNPPRLAGGLGDISCGQPYPTITGLKADNSYPYSGGSPPSDEYLEVFSNGYIEFGELIRPRGEEGVYIASEVEVPLIVNFMRFIEGIYEYYLPLAPIGVGLSVFNARGMWLAVSRNPIYIERDKTERWQDQHLELGKSYADNISAECKLLTKKMCDRLWQAFHRERCNLFDNNGTFRTS